MLTFLHVPDQEILSGPSGHGKSLISRNIGQLLQIPAHTVNMTNLRSQEELLESRSLSAPSGVSVILLALWTSTHPLEQKDLTLAGFLSLHEGRRCVVILEVHIKLFEGNSVLISRTSTPGNREGCR
jgi:ABC-type transporter Mla maintaining outer membrane lipid asymmetry ATPase subunit MlaF